MNIRSVNYNLNYDLRIRRVKFWVKTKNHTFNIHNVININTKIEQIKQIIPSNFFFFFYVK